VEPSGSVQASAGIALPLRAVIYSNTDTVLEINAKFLDFLV